MSHEEALSWALVLALALVYVYGWLDRKGCRCEKCAFHTNERRMAILKQKEDFERRQADQADLQHDYWHKGAGWTDTMPDKFPCPDKTCPRNPKRVS